MTKTDIMFVLAIFYYCLLIVCCISISEFRSEKPVDLVWYVASEDELTNTSRIYFGVWDKKECKNGSRFYRRAGERCLCRIIIY